MTLAIAHVIASIETESAGPSQSVPALARALAQRGNNVQLYSLGQPAVRTAEGVTYKFFRSDWSKVRLLSRIKFSSEMRRGLADRAASTDVFHVHGLWLMPNIYPAAATKLGKNVLVASPRGMLAPSALEFSTVQKRLMWIMWQREAIKRTWALHATSEQEYNDIRAFGITHPVAIIPNGIDLPRSTDFFFSNRDNVVLYIGRLHPIKALEDVIAAWANITAKHSTWVLRIVGPGEPAYVALLKAAANRTTRVSIEGPIYGAEKQKALSVARLFILASRSENFAMAVAEALAHSVPVIASKGTPWRALSEHHCGWWVENGVLSLTAALDAAMSQSPERLTEMGASGRAWMAADFGWDRVARDMQDVYTWLLFGGSLPTCTRLD